jgi:hypothetical protein
MHVDLIPWSCTTQIFAASTVAQAKERSYHNGHPIDRFFPLTIEIFECLHKQVDVFLHKYANVIWSLKGPKGLPLFVLVTFLCQRILTTLQRIQASSILSQVVAVGLVTSWLPPFTCLKKPVFSKWDLRLWKVPGQSVLGSPDQQNVPPSLSLFLKSKKIPALLYIGKSPKYSLFVIPMYIFRICGVFYK